LESTPGTYPPDHVFHYVSDPVRALIDVCVCTFFRADGSEYKGDWVEGKRSGQGIYVWPNVRCLAVSCTQ
jgi:hypothetical protein